MKRDKRVWLVTCLFILSYGIAHAQYTDPVAVETTAFGQDTFAIGSLSVADGAFAGDLWQDAEAADVAFLLDNVPARFSDPAQVSLLRKALLSPGDGPRGADSALTGKKLMALAEAGFYEQAASFAELSGSLNNQPALAQSAAYADMMRGDLSSACRRGANLQSGRNEEFWLKLRFMCYSIAGETDAADLTFDLLREQSFLSQTDAALFTALGRGAKLNKNILPQNGFQYAAIRQLQIPLDLNRLKEVDGAVLVALAREKTAPQQARIYAAERAVHFGLMSGRELSDQFLQFEFPVTRIAEANELVTDRADDALVDAIAFQAIQQMNAIEFQTDRAMMVGAALRAADSLERFDALASIYAPIAAQFEVFANYAPYAPEFALAGILERNDSLAARWVTALATDPARTDGLEKAVALLQLWSLRDENRAQIVGGYAGLSITKPQFSTETLGGTISEAGADLIPELVRVSLSSGGQNSRGQAALTALVASTISASGDMDNIREIVLANSIRVSEIEDILDERAFAIRAGDFIAELRSVSSTTSNSNSSGGPQVNIKPRVKPTLSD